MVPTTLELGREGLGGCLEIFLEDLDLLLESAAALAQRLVAAHIVRRPQIGGGHSTEHDPTVDRLARQIGGKMLHRVQDLLAGVEQILAL